MENGKWNNGNVQQQMELMDGNILTDLLNTTAPKITPGLRNLRLVEGGTLL
jgi:hypothetical protein